jgi:cellulose synthase/poly-beta-1,6-N-acetylglucosamine synthase-like glycosyltransferase
MKILYAFFVAVEAVVAIFVLLPGLMLLLHALLRAIVGKRSVLDRKPETEKEFDFAAIITAHQDTRFIPPLVDSLIRQTYGRLIIYVVADDCDTSGLVFEDNRVVVLRPEPAFHAKIRSIGHAVDHFARPHDVMVIFDSDNLVHPRYFEYLNEYFRRGYRAVQTHMLSKNIDAIYARLDSIGHVYNTFLERQVRMELGLSSCILGLGIAIETELYKEILYKNALGGFDKKLQADLVMRVRQLAFAKEAIVYDEKVEDGHTLEKQRTRWLFTYFHYFKINWRLFVTGLRRLNVRLAYFGFILLRPPLFILLGAACLFTVVNYFIYPPYALIWLGILFSFALSFVLIVLTQSRQKGMGAALFYVPLVVFRQMRAMLKIKTAGSSFLKTEHKKVMYIQDLLKDDPA